MDNNFKTGYTSRAKFNLADFWLRLGAFLIDVLFIFIVYLVSVNLFVKLLAYINIKHEISILSMFLTFLLYISSFLLFTILYYSIFESSKHQGTLGKIAIKIKVVDKEGNRLSFAHALGRNLSKILSSLIFYVGYLMVLWTKEKQALHDYLANTYVINTRSDIHYPDH